MASSSFLLRITSDEIFFSVNMKEFKFSNRKIFTVLKGSNFRLTGLKGKGIVLKLLLQICLFKNHIQTQVGKA
jgi:hypothetical protein